ncbi:MULTISPECIES: GIY-YIG nuclease family protein [unclassified Clostridioides]|uniref:GIY-YIG nuclease family protein n=1 Tax=unclassified Clostridioides TaxID=2635829 RepID=UPI001D11E0D9|nr:GIY-YIG nuclease family protein [Clostridioides sp. ZZV14-6150]MCC0717831.1 GIY-YIG nuclease family protein [Clostridioides sp. ZZV14-6105]MCC0727968.1 GIY-YIG nuclease family protein [Clostridioides sp. ZZV14-6045]MCC0732536.1 GIY-YIG nuclease family protein [Clostridioides sp. ZZV14-6048]MCC0736497.1 GIY-YIG nuclease family protein [Clostridioides sp. ZZV14-6009]
MDRKRELKQLYREMKFDIGVFMIKSDITKKIYLGKSNDIKSKFNFLKFQLCAGSCMVRDLNNAWKKYGEKAFTFEILELIKHDDNKTEKDYLEELDILEMVWLEKLKEDNSYEIYSL